MQKVKNPYELNNAMVKYGETWNTIVNMSPNKEQKIRDLERLPLTRLNILPYSYSQLNGDFVINPFTGNPIEKYEQEWWTIMKIAKNKGKMIETLEALPLFSAQIPIIASVSELDDVRVSRAGVILYSYVGDQVYLGLGLDAKYKELTSFAGGVGIREDSTKAALRELCEETLRMYCDITAKDIPGSLALYDKHELIIFLFLDEDPLLVSENFRIRKKNDKGKVEIEDIIWIEKDAFKDLVKNNSKKIYVTQRNFLAKNDQFYQYLI